MTERVTTIYSDASRGDECSGLGYVISGDVELSDNKTLYGTYTSMEAEYHALMEALRVASLHSPNRREVKVRTDCEPLVTKMKYKDRAEKWNERRRSFNWLVGKWDEFELGSVGRLANQDADRLAKQALDRGRRNV